MLLRRAALIVKRHHPLGEAGQVGDDEADAGKQLAAMSLHLGHHLAGPVPALGAAVEADIIAPDVLRRTADRPREQVPADSLPMANFSPAPPPTEAPLRVTKADIIHWWTGC